MPAKPTQAQEAFVSCAWDTHHREVLSRLCQPLGPWQELAADTVARDLCSLTPRDLGPCTSSSEHSLGCVGHTGDLRRVPGLHPL